MSKVIFISGPCGCGKSTFADAYARYLVDRDRKTVYVIHGDDYHTGFVEVEDKGDFFVNGEPSDSVQWEDILKFNWGCIIENADRALKQGMDVVIDYVIEGELSRITELAEQNRAELYYIVLTAGEEEIEKRIRSRGDLDMIERAKFLKRKLDLMPENRGHLYDNTERPVDEMVKDIRLEDFKVIRKRPKMILFDYGGTLLCEPEIDFLLGEKELFKHVISNPHGYTAEQMDAWETERFLSLKSVRDLDAELTEIQLLRLKYELHGIRLDIPYEEAEILKWEAACPMTESCRMPHIGELLTCLHDAGIRTGVISNIGWTGNALNKRIQELLPENHFEFVIASSDYGLRKPAADLYRVALEKAGLSAEDVWYCGDTFGKDIIGAHEAGIFPVYYRGIGPDDHCSAQQRAKDVCDADFPYLMINDWTELIEMII